LFGPNVSFASSFQGIPANVTLESASGSRNEFVAVLLLTIKNSNSGEDLRVMRVQVKFQSDSMAEKSYVRYVKLVKLISCQATEQQSYGSQMEDSQVFGYFSGLLQYFWD
jgi:hypothetical protein